MSEKAKCKVLHIITRLDTGGSSINTVETVARLNKDRFVSELISGRTKDPDQKIKKSLEAKGVRWTVLSQLRREINPFFDLAALIQLYQLIKKGNYDIVHTHTSKAGILGRWAAYWAGVKHIIHTPHGHIFYGYFNSAVTKVFIWIEQLTAKITDKIITLTERGKEEHVAFKIAKVEKFVPIYSGIDIQQLNSLKSNPASIRKSLNIPLDQFLFGTVARLDPIKGVGYLVEAMATVVKVCPHTHLLIVGDGSQRSEIEQRIRILKLDGKVTLTGFLDDVPGALQAMDVFVLPSINEGMGRVILEAFVYGKPVIASRTGGVPELVEDGVNGMLVPPANAELLSAAMARLALDPKFFCALGEQAKRSAADKFSIEEMVKKIENLYLEVMSVKL